VDAVDCRLRFWAQLRAHRTLAKGLRAWAAAVAATAAEEACAGAGETGSGVGEERHRRGRQAEAAAAAGGPSALAVRMEAMESEMLQWREEARERLLKIKSLTEKLREAEQLQVSNAQK
jgi:hypothetical protein